VKDSTIIPQRSLILPATAGTTRRFAAVLMAALAVGLLPAGHLGTSLVGPQIAQAQNFGQRNIQGKVLDDTETPVGGATVFLKNNKTRNVKSFTSTRDGAFRFAQVGMVDDYEVWAESGKKKSPVKTVSSFDSRKQVEFDLKLK
jgi:hypothetical protein